ncbi:MAG: PBP1A family penicillin-binding protein [Hyphomonadaceae bacterium]|nr:PBP1A family penicillin-binding protein [Hyphomonadaceae bacterium]
MTDEPAGGPPPGSPTPDPKPTSAADAARRGLDWTKLRAASAKSYMDAILAEKSRTHLYWAGGAALAAILVAFAGFWIFAIKDLPRMPDSASLWTLNRQPGVTFADVNGKTIGIRGAFYGRSVTYKELPPHVWQAFIAIEDRRFFEHRGVDRQGMIRAMLANVAAGGTVQGGSTITQQLVKNLFLTPERSIRRKLQEMILAGRIEARLTKDEILDLYLNRVDLGSQAFGVDAAARRYFGKSAMELTVAEAALIAGLPKAPTDLSPIRNLAKSKARQLVVLEAMQDAGYITSEVRAAAAEAPITLAGRTSGEGEMGYIFDMAVDEARKRSGQISPDLVLRLTVDVALQDAAVQTLRAGLGPLGRVKCPPPKEDAKGKTKTNCRKLQGALVMMDQRGAIRALVGGSNYEESKFNRATQARRQPGSSFKTFVFAAAIEQGLDPETVRYDEPITIQGWKPQNYDETFTGAVTLRTAFAQSLNTVAAEVADEVGVNRVADLACRFGVQSLPCTDEARRKTPIPPSIALGSMEVTLLEMTQAFSTFMRDGQRLDGFLIERVENSRGDVLYQRPAVNPLMVYEPDNAHTMNGMLGRVVQTGTGTHARLNDRDVAGKTGTSQDWRDAWFIGYTGNFTTGVWVGYDDFHPMPRITGGGAPAEIFASFMRVAERGVEPRDLPGVHPPPVSRARQEMSSFYRSLAEAFGKIIPGREKERRDDRP